MLVSTRIPVRLPTRLKKPTTIELRNRCLLFIVNSRKSRFEVVAQTPILGLRLAPAQSIVKRLTGSETPSRLSFRAGRGICFFLPQKQIPHRFARRNDRIGYSTSMLERDELPVTFDGAQRGICFLCSSAQKQIPRSARDDITVGLL